MRITAKIRTDYHEREVMQAVKQASVNPILKMGFRVEKAAKELLSVAGMGEPSAPGEPPHAQTGNLRASITTAKTDRGTAVVGPTRLAFYGKIHEFGGRKHPARPFMRPAYMQVKGQFAKEWRNLKLASTPAGQRLNSRKGKK